MPPVASAVSIALTVIIAVLVIAVPGLLVGFAAGLRGWRLAGMAPLFSYAVGGLTGPWAAALGLSFSVWTYLAGTALFAGVACGLRILTRRLRPPAPERPRWKSRSSSMLLHPAASRCRSACSASKRRWKR